MDFPGSVPENENVIGYVSNRKLPCDLSHSDRTICAFVIYLCCIFKPFNCIKMNVKKPITIDATIDAPVAKAWEYYNNADHVIHWNHASDDWHSPHGESDLRPGGKFNYRMEAKDGSFGFDFWGIYDEVIPNEKIIYTLGDGRKSTILFTDQGGTTKVEITFEAEETNPIEMQRGGWQAILNNYKKYTETH